MSVPAGIRAAVQRNPLLADLLLVGALVILGVVTDLVLVAPNVSGAPPPLIIVVWAVVLVAPLIARRRYPLTVLVITAVHFPVYWATGQINEIAAWLVLGTAIYSAAVYGQRPLATRVCAGVAVVQLGVGAVVVVANDLGGPVEAVAGTMFNALPFLVAWPLGSIVRSLRDTRTVLEDRNRQLDAERRANAQRAIVEERVRIARELHDVVAHHVSVIGVQAGVARRLFDRRPDRAAEAIASVETSSRQAIDELHQIVGFLRDAEPDTGRPTPQPDLDQLPALLAQVRDAGLPVELVVEGEQRPLPEAMELSAYRIVQEALTNTLKHASARCATVRLCYRPGGVDVEVLDDGSARPAAGGTGGRGLLGMRERAELHGGLLRTGPRPDGGFQVFATLNGASP